MVAVKTNRVPPAMTSGDAELLHTRPGKCGYTLQKTMGPKKHL